MFRNSSVLASLAPRATLPLLAAAGFLGIALQPVTAQADEPRSVTVQYGDLNIARPEGAARLYERLLQAARQVCEPVDARSLAHVAQSRRCVRDTLAAAVARVSQPQLTAYHVAKAGLRG